MPLSDPWRDLASRVLARLPGELGSRARFLRARARLGRHEEVRDLPALVRELLRYADRAHARGDATGAVDGADKALQLLFHPARHGGAHPGPLAERTLADLDPLRGGVVGRLLTSDPDPVRDPRPGGDRVLVLGMRSWTFVDRVVADLRAGTDLDIRVRDLAELPPAERPSRRGVLAARYAFSTRGDRVPVPPSLREDLEWADVVWCEWGSYEAVWATLLADLDARVVVRLHRFEAATPWPQLLVMSGIDALVFVAPHIRELVSASAPRTAQALSTPVLPNVNDLTRFDPVKEPGADRTLAQVGWAVPVKDVGFTLDLLDDLRAQDPSWRLLLVGTPLPEDPADPGTAALFSRLAAAGDAVEVVGRREDVPAVLRRAGYLVSSSRNEGTHEAVAEAAAAGCVPVIRDWPENAAWGGPASVYPADWVVADAAAGADRVRATDRAGRDRTGLAARTAILARRDPDRIRERTREVLRGEGAPTP